MDILVSKLENISPGKFEKLVNDIARFKYNLSFLTGTGLNKEDKSIICPVDAIGVSNSNPQHYFLVESTTSQKDNLREKWLDKKEGDIYKAEKQAKSIIENNKDVKITLILAVNRKLDGNSGYSLIKDVLDLNLCFDIKFLDQDEICNFLNNSNDGHWLRKEHLCIESERLSKYLLSEMCKRNLEDYKKRLQLSDNLIERDIKNEIKDNIINNSILFLVGESGFGKSVLSYQLLENHIANGGYGLWLDENILKEFSPLEYCIGSLLKKYIPTLENDVGNNITDLLGSNETFLIVIDDLNNLENLNNLKNITTLVSTDDESKKNISPFSIICPLWSKNYEIFLSKSIVHNNMKKISITKFTDEESCLFIRSALNEYGIKVSDIKIKDYATKLENDPFSIGLFNSLLFNNKDSDDLDNMIDNVFERFLENKLNSIPSDKFIFNDFDLFLTDLSSKMLINRNLNPEYQTLLKWSKNEDKEILRLLSNNQNICKLIDNKLYFVHDRILNYYLVKAMVNLIDEDKPHEIFYDPFYSNIIGESINFINNNEKFIQDLSNKNPLVLFESIKYINENNFHYNLIINLIEKKFSELSLESNPSFMESIVNSWYELDSNLVLKLFSKCNYALIPCFRNGSIIHGVYHSMGLLGVKDTYFNQIISHVDLYHKNKVIKDLNKILLLNNVSDDVRKGAFNLAGFFGYSEFEDSLIKCWNLCENKKKCLDSAIFAFLRCYDKNTENIINLFVYWDELLKLDDEYLIETSLKFAFENYPISKEVFDLIIKNFKVYEDLSFAIWSIFSLMNTYFSFDYCLKFISSKQGTDIVFIMWLDFWKYPGRILDDSLFVYLKEIWSNNSNNKNLRINAFKLWCERIDINYINELKGISEKDDIFINSLSKRIELGDLSTIKYIKKYFKEENIWNFIHTVWSEDIKIWVEDYFINSINNKNSTHNQYKHISMANFLAKIPIKDSEYFIEKYWHYMKNYYIFIQLNFYLGTDLTIGLNESLFKESNISKNEVFKHFVTHFIFTYGFNRFNSLKHFNNLLPYLKYFDEINLLQLFRKASDLKLYDWIKVAKNEVNVSNKYTKSDDELILELEYLEDMQLFYWLKRFDERGDNKERIINILDIFLERNQTFESLRKVGICIKEKGTREDLSLLNKFDIPQKEIIINDVAFAVKQRTLN